MANLAKVKSDRAICKITVEYFSEHLDWKIGFVKLFQVPIARAIAIVNVGLLP